MNTVRRPRWDLFCRVVDNYGDAGVCWRLARQLASEFTRPLRLWIDDPACLAQLCPPVDPALDQQLVDGVDIRRWPTGPADFPAVAAADVVIECFACELPATYLQTMAALGRKPCWVNLEYLSAEAWIEGCHGLASPHPTLALQKYFFFPGFTSASGGLLRASALPENAPTATRESGTLQVSLFCYDDAPVAPLLAAWRQAPQPVHCRVAAGKAWQAVLAAGAASGRHGSLTIEPLPFLPQDDYDRLLTTCDLNLVRGEDSFVRAQWAGKPFAWQIYAQADRAHLDKLTAFVDRYLADADAATASAVRNFFQAWNGTGGVAASWPAYAAALPRIAAHNFAWRAQLMAQENLAAQLVEFCESKI